MTYDVVVCGGGPSGVAAAVSAARSGARVCLIERYGFCGGMGTAALVNPFAGHEHVDPNTGQFGSLTGGFFREIVRDLSDRGAYGSALTPSAFDEEQLKLVLDRKLADAGVSVFYHGTIGATEARGRRVESVKVLTKEGDFDVRGRVFVDATGDGDVASGAGAAMTVGRAGDGLTQAMTMSFRMANVDKTAMEAEPGHAAARLLVEPYFHKARSEGRLDYPHRDWVHFYDYPRAGVLHFNMTRVNEVSGLSWSDLTSAEREGRRQAQVFSDWLIRDVPWFAHAHLQKLACSIGVRETRHLDGPYVMTQADIAAGRKFPDGIARSRYFIDIHSPTGSGFDHESGRARKDYRADFAPPPGDWYEVPYRSMVAKELDNVLVPCRALSATHEASGAVRVMATMYATGEAAGIAAGLALERRTDVGSIDGAEVRKRLAYLDAPPDLDPMWPNRGYHPGDLR